MEVQHFSHNHPLSLMNMANVGDSREINCVACSEKRLDLIYSCQVCDNYNIHKSCAELPEKITSHPFHSFHPLSLMLWKIRYACCGCGKWGNGLFYCCTACNFTLHPECALRPTSKYEILGEGKIQFVHHKHPLILMNEIAETDMCCGCQKPCSGESYSCLECPNFRIHKSCIDKLPRSIQHEAHLEHPMMLRTKDRYFDRPCVACGREDNILTYRCSMCKFEMDLECAFSKDVDVRAISNNHLTRSNLSGDEYSVDDDDDNDDDHQEEGRNHID